MEHLESFLGDCDIRVEQAKRRLKETQEELSDEQAAKVLFLWLKFINLTAKQVILWTKLFQANKIHDIGELIGTKLAKAEQLGEQGDVEESLKLMAEVEDLKKQKISAEVMNFITNALRMNSESELLTFSYAARIQKHDALLELPTTETPCLRGLQCLPWHLW